jgi:hypothetical protein
MALICKHSLYLSQCTSCTEGREQSQTASDAEREWSSAAQQLFAAFNADLVVAVAGQHAALMSCVVVAPTASHGLRIAIAVALRELADRLELDG